MLKKTLKILLIALLVVLTAAFAAPFIFRDKIRMLVKKEINKKLNARVEFSDVALSFFRQFPRVSLGVDSLSVTGKAGFSTDTLFSASGIDVAVNFWALFGNDGYDVYAVNLRDPRIHAIVSKDGSVNWNIMKPDSAAASSAAGNAPFRLRLQRYSLSNGYIRYDDQQGNMSAEVAGLEHSGSGDFTADKFNLKTTTSADAVTFTYGNIPWLNHTKTIIDADISVDNSNSKYSFNTDKISLNDLPLSASGFFQLLPDSAYAMDIRYNAPSTDFKNLLSLVPAVYSKDFKQVKTSGKILFNGFVKGKYSAASIPAYQLNLGITDASFQYPDLPTPLRNINLTAKVDNPDGVTDHTVVNIPRAHFELGYDPFDLRLLLTNPATTMFIDGAAKGKIDLGQLTKLVKLDPGTAIQGLLNADLIMKGSVAALQKKQYDNFNMAGTMNLAAFGYRSKAYPGGISLSRLQAIFNPKTIVLPVAEGKYQSTSFSANGALDNVLPYVLKNEALSGILNLKADQVNLNEWMKTGTDSVQQPGASAAPFAVPANLAVTVNAAADKVLYENISLGQVSGKLGLNNETVTLDGLKAALLDGLMVVNGSYSTKESKLQPAFSFDYAVTGFDVEKTFASFNTVRALMPVGKFLSGKINSALTISGRLDKNMSPLLSSLTGKGNLLLVDGLLKKFAPVEKIANLLQVEQLQSFSMKDVKAFFEFAQGKVLVKPFTVKVQGIDMEIGGMHGFDQSLDYLIHMKVPRAMMGTAGNSLVNNLVAQVNARGIPVNVGDQVNLTLHMGGTITHPAITTDLRQAAGSLAADLKQQALDFARTKIDSTREAVKTAARDTLNSLKTQAVQAAAGELKKRLFGNADTTAGSKGGTLQPAEAAKGLLQGINPFGRKKKTADSTANK